MTTGKPQINCNYAAAVVLKKDKDSTKMLILKRAEETLNGIWCHVAGRIEDNEKAWETALREIKEETDLKPYEFYSSDYCEVFYETDKNSIAMVPAFVAFVKPDAKVVLNSEHSDFKWVTIEQACEMVPFRTQRELYNCVKEEFILRSPQQLLKIEI